MAAPTTNQLVQKLLDYRNVLRLAFRNQHVFPVPAAYQPNEAVVTGRLRAIETHVAGYLAVVAPAGAGKSSLLTATVLPARRTIDYCAYTPASPDPSTGRGESENFFYDVVTALDGAGLHTTDVVDTRDYPEVAVIRTRSDWHSAR